MSTKLTSIPVGEDAPSIVYAVIEIPMGSRNKYQYRPDLDAIVLNRVLSSAVRYPADYGFIPSTRMDDGDPLDVLVISTEPTYAGCVLRARPIGVLDMSDEHGHDSKIIAVPEDDPRFTGIATLGDLPEPTLREVEHFFAVYKQLEGKPVEIHGWGDVAQAHELIRTRALHRSWPSATLPGGA